MNRKTVGAARRMAVAAGAIGALSAFAADGDSLPPRPAPGAAASPSATPPTAFSGNPVRAVLVKSWGGCSSSGLVWEDMNARWWKLGNTAIHIDYSNPALCTDHFDYAALEASGADTVILSDPDGTSDQFSDQEVQDLTRYVQEGHTLIGTFLLLQSGQTDNRALAPLFGLDPMQQYPFDRNVSTDFVFRDRVPLFKGLEGIYASKGYPASQEPPQRHWSTGATAGAKVIAADRGHRAAILSYCGGSYRALYFTWMPEYRGNAQDEQVLYNAIVSGAQPGCGSK